MREALTNEEVRSRFSVSRIAGRGIFHLFVVIVTLAGLGEKALNSEAPPLVSLAILVLLCVACFLCLAGLFECRATAAAGRGNYLRPVRTVLVGLVLVGMHIFAKASCCCCAPLGYQ